MTRTDLAQLGLGRSAIDSVFGKLDVIVFPDTRRPYVRREDYLALLVECSYGDNRVRP